MARASSSEEIKYRAMRYEKEERKKLGNPERITKWVEGVKEEPNYAKNFERMWKQMPEDKKIEFLRKKIKENQNSINYLNMKNKLI